MKFLALFFLLPFLAYTVQDKVATGFFIMAWMGLIFIFLLHMATGGLADLIAKLGGKD